MIAIDKFIFKFAGLCQRLMTDNLHFNVGMVLAIKNKLHVLHAGIGLK